MKKYIDADKLIAEIERRKADAKLHDMSGGYAPIYDELLSIIASLQHEQPEPSCKSCGFYENNCPFIRGKLIPYPNKVCKDYTYSVMKEQPEVDLEKEMKEYLGENWKDGTPIEAQDDMIKFARHFYELGLNARNKKDTYDNNNY